MRKTKQELWNTIQDKALEECWEYPLTYTNFVMVSQKNVTGLDAVRQLFLNSLITYLFMWIKNLH